MGWESINLGTVVASSRLSTDLPLSLLPLEPSTKLMKLLGGSLSLTLPTNLKCPLGVGSSHPHPGQALFRYALVTSTDQCNT